MSYIGQQLPADVFGGYTTDTFAGDGSATTFTLSQAPFNEQGLIVVINNVIQQPTTNYTVSGTTLTIVGTAVASGDVIYARHTGGALPIGEANALDLQGQSDKLILDADADTTISAETDDQIDFKAGGTDVMSMTATGLTINDGTTITTADNTDTLTLKSTDADANTGPILKLLRDSGSPADNDLCAVIKLNGDNDANEDTQCYEIRAAWNDVSNGTEDGAVRHALMVGGTLRDVMTLDSGITVFNEDSQDIDFRVEGNGINDVLFVNAGTDSLCVGRQAGESAERLSVEQASADWNTVKIHSLASGNLYMINNKFTAQAPDNNVSYFMNFQDFDGSGATIRFRIFSDGDVQNHDNSYGSTSDERIKQGIRDASSQWDDIKALKVRNFKKNDDVRQYGDKAWEQIGVIAQELEASGMDKLVKKETVWDKDDPEVKSGEATEGDIKEYKAVKYSVLYMKAIKALQEAMAKIETLETKVKALEDA